MKHITFHLLEGERIIALLEHEGFLWVKTNLDRYFRSTQTPVEQIDFIEVEAGEKKGDGK